MRLTNEVNILKLCKHDGLMKLKEVYESKQYVNLVFDYYKGEYIFSAISRWKKYKESDAKKIMKSLLQTIEHLHKNDIMHRDIKPQIIHLQYLLKLHIEKIQNQ